MERLMTAFVALAAAVSLGWGALAQEPVRPAPSSQAAQVSDQDLQTFARIYEDLQISVSKHEAQMATAQTDDDARKVQASFQEESVATVAKHGWTPDKYNSVVDAIKADPQLSEKAIALIDD